MSSSLHLEQHASPSCCGFDPVMTSDQKIGYGRVALGLVEHEIKLHVPGFLGSTGSQCRGPYWVCQRGLWVPVPVLQHHTLEADLVYDG